jgi:mRNA-degrading endonuclease RelE of RelBE toxin-antitoxin system
VTAREVSWTATATKSLSHLPEKVGTAVVEFVYGALALEPARVGKALRFELEGLRVARRGDYRVIYEIREDRGDVLIHVIEHRADVYRRR